MVSPRVTGVNAFIFTDREYISKNGYFQQIIYRSVKYWRKTTQNMNIFPIGNIFLQKLRKMTEKWALEAENGLETDRQTKIGRKTGKIGKSTTDGHGSARMAKSREKFNASGAKGAKGMQGGEKPALTEARRHGGERRKQQGSASDTENRGSKKQFINPTS